ncbi:CPBP family intramembrane glutamic endopeptidase [Butyrivibrio sp. MB2005]|uniref:CPBP family intramembrane glutamic endopeptidase n=1 Tax=Butyrivibrio sp. MB2005 TaxID=1280678 RepID=UPI0004113274|nr:CPBP family intramembrane glutamic endopeptidase [Butyrivibrio sp. MB2005]
MIKNEKLKWLNVIFWLASVAAMIGLMIGCGRFFDDSTDMGLLIEFVIITVVTLGFLYLISGKKTFTYLTNETGYTVKMLWPTLIFSGIFALFGVLAYFIDKPPLKDNWLLGLIISAISMFLVGVYEEGCFRACACDALLPILKKTKHPFFWTALISGLIFGYVHVVSFDFTDLQQTLQFFLKIANLLITGATYMILYWKTRNLLGLAIVHGLNDFLPDFLNHIFEYKSQDDSEAYITGDASTTIVYVIQLVIELLCFIYVYKKVAKKIDYKKTLDEWCD